MADPVSRFQAEVAAIMDLLLKVAVMEITRVFEGRSRLDQDHAEIHEDLRGLPDLRAFGARPPRGSVPRAVHSVGVQAGEPAPALGSQEESHMQAPHLGEGQPPTETPSLDLEETLDVQCTVDLPCTIFKEQILKGEIAEDLAVETTWTANPPVELSTEQNGHESRDFPLPSPANSTTVDIPSTDTLDQSGFTIKEADFAQPVPEPVKVELLDSFVSSTELSQALDCGLPATVQDGRLDSSLGEMIVKFQLSDKPLDCKLLQPCSVQLVNFRSFSDAKKITDIAVRKGSSIPKDLRTHQHIHTGRRLCCFTKCGDGVWCLQDSLTRRRSLSCKICGKKYKRRKLLRRHERFHTGERPYYCSKCDKTFALRKSLRRHERFHTGERPHSCPQCSKCFRLKDNLKAHMRFHTGEKPYTCSLCYKGFRIQKNLEKHASVHGRFCTIK